MLQRMIRWLVITAGIQLLASCRALDSIPYTPRQTPENWLRTQPFAHLRMGSSSILIVQPSTSAIVYLLGLMAIAAGIYFWRVQQGHRSRRWWALALVLWGVGALLAGTSYEAFSYQIKCAGRAACVWTSVWEILYLLLSAGSVNAMLAAVAYSCSSGNQRKALLWIAGVDFGVYVLVVATGFAVPVRWMISFELLLAFCAPIIAVMLFINARRYFRWRLPLDLALLGVWIWLILTIAAYFSYYLSGLTQTLWARGAWFSENDVLHIGLILWMAYIVLAASRWIVDQPRPGN